MMYQGFSDDQLTEIAMAIYRYSKRRPHKIASVLQHIFWFDEYAPNFKGYLVPVVFKGSNEIGFWLAVDITSKCPECKWYVEPFGVSGEDVTQPTFSKENLN